MWGCVASPLGKTPDRGISCAELLRRGEPTNLETEKLTLVKPSAGPESDLKRLEFPLGAAWITTLVLLPGASLGPTGQ